MAQEQKQQEFTRMLEQMNKDRERELAEARRKVEEEQDLKTQAELKAKVQLATPT